MMYMNNSYKKNQYNHHILCIKSDFVSGIYLKYAWQVIGKNNFEPKFNFYFFADRRILKFLNVKCNPANKTPLPYLLKRHTDLKSISFVTIRTFYQDKSFYFLCLTC